MKRKGIKYARLVEVCFQEGIISNFPLNIEHLDTGPPQSQQMAGEGLFVEDRAEVYRVQREATLKLGD